MAVQHRREPPGQYAEELHGGTYGRRVTLGSSIRLVAIDINVCIRIDLAMPECLLYGIWSRCFMW